MPSGPTAARASRIVAVLAGALVVVCATALEIAHLSRQSERSQAIVGAVVAGLAAAVAIVWTHSGMRPAAVVAGSVVLVSGVAALFYAQHPRRTLGRRARMGR
jgi:hypothetical protein